MPSTLYLQYSLARRSASVSTVLGRTLQHKCTRIYTYVNAGHCGAYAVVRRKKAAPHNPLTLRMGWIVEDFPVSVRSSNADEVPAFAHTWAWNFFFFHKLSIATVPGTLPDLQRPIITPSSRNPSEKAQVMRSASRAPRSKLRRI